MPNSKSGNLKRKEIKSTLKDENEALAETRSLIKETKSQRFTSAILTGSALTQSIADIDKSLHDLDSLQTDARMNSQQYREAALQKAQLKAQKARLKIAQAVKRNDAQGERVAAALNQANKTGKITSLKRLLAHKVRGDSEEE